MNAIATKTAPDPRIADFVRLVGEGENPLKAANKSGLSPASARATLANPAVVVALQRELSARFLAEIVPKAINRAGELLDRDNLQDMAKARLVGQVLTLFARASVQERMEKTNKTKSLDEMSLDELEAAAGSLRNELDDRRGIIDVEPESVT